MEPIRVLSFNIRVPVAEDGINTFSKRKGRLCEYLLNESPDLVGFQEATDAMRKSLCLLLGSRYALIGGGREKDWGGEGCPILYRPDRMELLSFRQFWLSDEPDVPGSRFEHSDQSSCPRVAAIAQFRLRGGERLALVNTHLDHMGAGARKLGLATIAGELAGLSVPAFLVGDFNATPDSDELVSFCRTVEPLGWADRTASLGGTFHGFGVVSPPMKIDYLFSNIQPRRVWIGNDEPSGGQYLSDHLPVWAEF